MKSRQIQLCNRLGLHARAASKLVQTAAEFESDIRIRNGHRQVNAKSIMGILMLAATCGTELELEAEGPDEDAAIQALTDLIDNRFGEEQ